MCKFVYSIYQSNLYIYMYVCVCFYVFCLSILYISVLSIAWSIYLSIHLIHLFLFLSIYHIYVSNPFIFVSFHLSYLSIYVPINNQSMSLSTCKHAHTIDIYLQIHWTPHLDEFTKFDLVIYIHVRKRLVVK